MIFNISKIKFKIDMSVHIMFRILLFIFFYQLLVLRVSKISVFKKIDTTLAQIVELMTNFIGIEINLARDADIPCGFIILVWGVGLANVALTLMLVLILLVIDVASELEIFDVFHPFHIALCHVDVR